MKIIFNSKITGCILAVLVLLPSCRNPHISKLKVDDIDVSLHPLQEVISEDQSFVISNSEGKFTLKPLADYTISAKVVATKSYSRGWESSFSPMDLALIWGELNNPLYLKNIKFSQRGRWYYFRYDRGFPKTVGFIYQRSSNNHIIPANHNLKMALKSIKTGDFIYIEGCLVNITGKIGNRDVWWRSSTSRKDTGDGSCELIYAEKIHINNKEYQ